MNEFDSCCRVTVVKLFTPEGVANKLSVMTYSCMHGQAPQYLMDFCHPASSVTSRQQFFWSASRQLLVIPCCRLSTTARRPFSAADPSAWNPCQMMMIMILLLAEITFRQHLKVFMFASYQHIQRIWGFTFMRYINLHWHCQSHLCPFFVNRIICVQLKYH